MREPALTNFQIANALRGHDAALRKEALRCLFQSPKLRNLAISHVRKQGGNQQDGEDIFQEAIIIFDRKTREGHFRGEGELEAFFMGIVRWHCFNTRKKERKSKVQFQTAQPEPVLDGNPEMDFIIQERRETLEKLLKNLNEKCRNILKMYQLDYSMEEIAAEMGYANSGVAKKETFLCRQRFRALLKNEMPELSTF